MKHTGTIKAYNFSALLMLGVALCLAWLNNHPKTSNPTNLVVSGLVVDATSNKPVSNTHVYIVHGEEEDLTNTRGEFKIETSKKLPLTIYAEHAGYEKFERVVSTADKKQVIKLKPKSND